MMQKNLAFIAIVGIVGCADGVQPGAPVIEPPLFSASASTDRTERVIVGFTASNPCTGEDIVYDGTIAFVLHQTIDPAGGIHVSGSANLINFTAVGASSGITYHVVGRSYRMFDVPFQLTASGASVAVFDITQLWVSEGSADNAQFNTRLTVVVNADGAITVDGFVDSTNCRG